MRKYNLLLLAALVALAAPAIARADGGGLVTGDTSASSYSTVTVTIPGIVAIDIESDISIDLNDYPTPTTWGGTCGSTFPPAIGCTGAADYPATGNSTTAGVPSPPAATDNEMWVAVFCNNSTGDLSMSAYASDAWGTQDPFQGSSPQDLQFKAAAANNTLGVGGTSYVAFGTAASPVTVNLGTLGSTFGWTRIDQAIQLHVPSAGTATFNAGDSTATVTYTISRS